MGGTCGQAEVGLRRRTDRPPDASAPRAPDAPADNADVRRGCFTLGIDALPMWGDPVMHKRPPGSSVGARWNQVGNRTGRRRHRAQRAHGDAFTPSSELHTLVTLHHLLQSLI